jgi:hypothetical protein
MPIMTLTKTDNSKTGKLRAYFDNKHKWQDAYYCGQNVVLPEIGTVMDCQTVAKSFKREDGSESITWFLQAWGKAGTASVTAPSAPAPYAAAPVAASPSGLRIDSGDQLRFISNMVGSAITAGTIKAPVDMAYWAKEAFKIVRALERGVFNDPEAEPKVKAERVTLPTPPAPEAGDPGPLDDPFGDPLNDKVPF